MFCPVEGIVFTTKEKVLFKELGSMMRTEEQKDETKGRDWRRDV